MKHIDVEQALRARGQKTFGYLPVAYRYDQTEIALPVMVVAGEKPGPTFLVDGCAHGDEHEGAEAIIKVARELDPAVLSGTFIGVPVVNVLAFEQGERFAPIAYYGSDLNRAYPGDPTGRITQRIAHLHFTELVSRADFAITMHGGGNRWTLKYAQAVYETTGNSDVDDKALKMARAFGPKFLWRGGAFQGTVRQEAVKKGIPMITIELGGQALRDEHRQEYVDLCARGFYNVMRDLGMLPGRPEVDCKAIVVDTPTYITNTHAGFYRPGVASGERVAKGTVLGTITDLFGDEVEVIKAPFDGVVCSQWSYPMTVTGNWVIIMARILEE